MITQKQYPIMDYKNGSTVSILNAINSPPLAFTESERTSTEDITPRLEKSVFSNDVTEKMKTDRNMFNQAQSYSDQETNKQLEPQLYTSKPPFSHSSLDFNFKNIYEDKAASSREYEASRILFTSEPLITEITKAFQSNRLIPELDKRMFTTETSLTTRKFRHNETDGEKIENIVAKSEDTINNKDNESFKQIRKGCKLLDINTPISSKVNDLLLHPEIVKSRCRSSPRKIDDYSHQMKKQHGNGLHFVWPKYHIVKPKKNCHSGKLIKRLIVQ